MRRIRFRFQMGRNSAGSQRGVLAPERNGLSESAIEQVVAADEIDVVSQAIGRRSSSLDA